MRTIANRGIVRRKIILGDGILNNIAKQVTKAFPSVYREPLLNIANHVPNDIAHFREETEVFYVNDTVLFIPYRIYYDADLINEDALTPVESELVYTLFTRHHSGYVRHECLKKMVSQNHILRYQIPFVFKLCGEYVLDIIIDAFTALRLIECSELKRFISQNEESIRKIEARLVSYWNEYYRKPTYGVNSSDMRYNWEEYIGCSIIRYLREYGYKSK